MTEPGGGKGLRVFSPEYYAVCAAGGMFSAGATHLASTPLDVLKVHMQVNPGKYSSIFSGLHLLIKERGPSSLWRGWSGKLFGYGAQGACKFGLYEYFKKMYSDVLVGQDKGVIFLASSASAQVIADVALCPFEAVKVRVQTQPNFAKGLGDGFPKLYAYEASTGDFFLFGVEIFHSLLLCSQHLSTLSTRYTIVFSKRRRRVVPELNNLGLLVLLVMHLVLWVLSSQILQMLLSPLFIIKSLTMCCRLLRT